MHDNRILYVILLIPSPIRNQLFYAITLSPIFRHSQDFYNYHFLVTESGINSLQLFKYFFILCYILTQYYCLTLIILLSRDFFNFFLF